MKSKYLLKPLSAGLLLATLLVPTALQAAATDPVGYTTITPTPSANGTTRAFTVASFPLTDSPVFAGALTSEPGTATLTVSTATFGSYGPSNGFVTHVVVPFTGDATGRVYPIESNTATVITVDLPDGISNLGTSMNSGDQIRVIPVNTLNKIFGSTSAALTTLGWTQSDSQATADLVYIWNGSGWVAHWFNNQEGFWVSIFNEFEDQGNTPIFSDEAVWISRRSQGEMKIVIDGSVPVSPFAKLQLLGPSSPGGRNFTFVSNPYPKAITLSSLNLTSLPGWIQSDSQAVADVVYFWNGAGWVAHWFNNQEGFWVSIFNEFEDQGGAQIPSGGGVWVARRSQTPSGETAYANLPIPFTP